MTPEHDGELPPLDGLDALDRERAEDMVSNRPRYAPAVRDDSAPDDLPRSRPTTKPPGHQPEVES